MIKLLRCGEDWLYNFRGTSLYASFLVLSTQRFNSPFHECVHQLHFYRVEGIRLVISEMHFLVAMMD
jgi:hypothetical protein